MGKCEECDDASVPDVYDVTQPSILACIGEKGIRRATVITDCAYTITTRQDRTPAQQSKIEETVRAELRQEVEETDREMDVLEYHMRKYCDTDDIEATEFGKENAVDD